MNSIISVGYDLIPPVMHTHQSLYFVEYLPSHPVGPRHCLVRDDGNHYQGVNEDLAVGSPMFFLLFSYKPLGLMWLSEQCDRPVGCTEASYQA